MMVVGRGAILLLDLLLATTDISGLNYWYPDLCLVLSLCIVAELAFTFICIRFWNISFLSVDISKRFQALVPLLQNDMEANFLHVRCSNKFVKTHTQINKILKPLSRQE